MRVRHLAITLLAICACLPASAHAAPGATLRASLTPERLGHDTTVRFEIQIAAPPPLAVPPPLSQATVSYPKGLGIGLSGLGTGTCSAERLEAQGPRGCPRDSIMGEGTALAGIPLQSEPMKETADVTLLRAPEANGNVALFLYALAKTPIVAALVFPGRFIPAPTPFGGRIQVDVPAVPSFPGEADVAIIRIAVRLDPQHLVYYEREHGRRVAYKPRGILLPRTCPRGGFPFNVALSFTDGSSTSAHTAVPCPGHSPRR